MQGPYNIASYSTQIASKDPLKSKNQLFDYKTEQLIFQNYHLPKDFMRATVGAKKEGGFERWRFC